MIPLIIRRQKVLTGTNPPPPDEGLQFETFLLIPIFILVLVCKICIVFLKLINCFAKKDVVT